MEQLKYKSTVEAMIAAKSEITTIVNNADANGYKFANLVSTQNEVNRVLEGKGLNVIEMSHYEESNYERQQEVDVYEWVNKSKTKVGTKVRTTFISKGYMIFTIQSLWDTRTLVYRIPAVFENGKPQDATYGANSIAYRYFLVRAFGIPTMDEDEYRKKEIEKEKETKETKEKKQIVSAVEKPKATPAPKVTSLPLFPRIIEILKGDDLVAKEKVSKKIKELLGLQPEEKFGTVALTNLKPADLEIILNELV